MWLPTGATAVVQRASFAIGGDRGGGERGVAMVFIGRGISGIDDGAGCFVCVGCFGRPCDCAGARGDIAAIPG
jgi:hypothetical protein